MTDTATRTPNPGRIFEAINAFQQSAALRAAIELDLFTHVGDGATESAELAVRCGSSERGVRILADYLVVHGFLTKSAGQYALTPESALFLTKSSPAYLGGATEFLHSPTIVSAFADLTATVRRGTTQLPPGGTMAPEHEVWERFARAMAPMMMPTAQAVARHVLASRPGPLHVLDVAASHGVYGLAFAQQNPAARVTALDWANVVKVAAENAAKFGVADRFDTIAGSIFDADLRGPYDVVLLPNILHHFTPEQNTEIARRVKSALKPGGLMVTVEFVPNDDRVSPPMDAAFALTMLATTPAGDAFTFGEYQRMFAAAGFQKSELVRPDGIPAAVIISA
jgi:predicted O-methyltransferase YrrM